MSNRTPRRIRIGTPKRLLEPHHRRSVLFAEHLSGVVYLSARSVGGDIARIWISENQAQWLARWLRSRLNGGRTEDAR
jgi:hypothetical protein